MLLKPAYRALYALHYAVKYGLMRLTAYLYFEPVVRSRCAAAGKNLQLWKLPRLRGQPEICLGNNVNIYGEWFVESNGQSGDSTLVIGDRVEIGHRVLFMVNGGVVIEEYANIAGGTTIGAGNLYAAGSFPSDSKSKPTRIGARVWIGRGSVIARGVTLGEGAIVGSNSVVVHDVPAFSIVAGNPACIILKDNRAKPAL